MIKYKSKHIAVQKNKGKGIKFTSECEGFLGPLCKKCLLPRFIKSGHSEASKRAKHNPLRPHNSLVSGQQGPSCLRGIGGPKCFLTHQGSYLALFLLQRLILHFTTVNPSTRMVRKFSPPLNVSH